MSIQMTNAKEHRPGLVGSAIFFIATYPDPVFFIIGRPDPDPVTKNAAPDPANLILDNFFFVHYFEKNA